MNDFIWIIACFVLAGLFLGLGCLGLIWLPLYVMLVGTPVLIILALDDAGLFNHH